MVRVCFSAQSGRIKKFCVCGHSGYAEEGKDIVCAAVSACVQLVETAINDQIHANATVKVDRKKPRIALTLPDMLREDALIRCGDVLRAFYRVMRAQEKKYGKYLKVKVLEV